MYPLCWCRFYPPEDASCNALSGPVARSDSGPDPGPHPRPPARAETVAGIETAWRGWMTKSGRSTGGLAVMHGGRLVHEAAMGQERPGASVPLASLSKAVTGVCVAGLVDRGRLAFDTPLSQALARTFARLGAPADPRMQGVTIGQLLVHRAGFDRADGGDPVTGRLATYLRSATATRPSIDEQMKWVLRRRLTDRARRTLCLHQRRLPDAGRRHRGGERTGLRGLLPQRHAGAARSPRRGARSGVAHPGELRRLAHAARRLRPLLPGLRREQSARLGRRRGAG